MSAYVVKDQTINRILAWLHEDAASEARSCGLGALALVGPDLRCAMSHGTAALAEACEKLGHDLHDLNVQAVRGHYPDADEAGMIGDGYQWQRQSPAGPVQTYKSLRCWLYQCAEGKTPDSPLYQAMEQVRDALANRIVTDSTEYDEANWD